MNLNPRLGLSPDDYAAATLAELHSGNGAAAPAAPTEAPRKVFYTLHELLEVEPEPPALMTPNGQCLIPGEGIMLLSGPTGSGKTFIAAGWAIRTALLGLKTSYFIAEGFKGMRHRLWAYINYHGHADNAALFENFAIADSFPEFTRGLNLKIPGAAAAHLRNHGAPPAIDIAFVDTFRSIGHVDNENDNAEISRIIQGFRQLARIVVLIHHTRKDGTVFAGAGSFTTDTDSHAEVYLIPNGKDEGERQKYLPGIVGLRCGQHRDHAPFDETAYKLEPFENTLVAIDAGKGAIAESRAEVKGALEDEFLDRILELIDAGITAQKDLAKKLACQTRKIADMTDASPLIESYKRGRIKHYKRIGQ